MKRGIFTTILAVASLARVVSAGDFVAGGPNTRGRVTVDKQAVKSDWGTLLRGACWCQDCHGGTPARGEFAAIKMAGLNSIHVYVEKNDDKPVGYEATHMDSIVEWCRQESLYVVMTFGNSHLPSYGKVSEFWRFYAPRYADMTHVVYEIKNEACSATYHCADDAMQMYFDCYKIIRDVAPYTHAMFMSHSNLKGGINSCYEDIERLKAANVDWTNASYAFHGYAPSAGEQEQMIKSMGERDIAMSCTEFPFGGGLAQAYERAGISYFWFEACWGGARTPGNIKGYLSGTGVSWQPDFGNWPKPHVEHQDMVAITRGREPRIAGRHASTDLGLFTPGNLGQGAVSAMYDMTGKLVWTAHGGACRTGAAGGFAPMLGSKVFLVKYTR